MDYLNVNERIDQWVTGNTLRLAQVDAYNVCGKLYQKTSQISVKLSRCLPDWTTKRAFIYKIQTTSDVLGLICLCISFSGKKPGEGNDADAKKRLKVIAINYSQFELCPFHRQMCP